MLLKCVCSNCGHSYLSDDEMVELACPRCDVLNDAARNPSDIPDAPAGLDAAFVDHLDVEFSPEPPRFEAKAPPPMFITRERVVRGLVFGSLAAGTMAAVLGAALAAISVDVPALGAVVIALVGGAACRSGFGGRSAPQTKGRAVVICAVVCVFGFVGFIGGMWGVERLTGTRALQTHRDLDEGLKGLRVQYGDAQDAGVAVVLKQRIEEVRRLRSLSDPQIEDYLWIQQAQVNQPLLAYAKLRIVASPLVRMGPERKPIRAPKAATMGIRLAEIILAMVLAARATRPK